MNYRFGRAANAAEKKKRLSSAALALAVGLALAFPSAAALAIQGEPIVKIPIGLEGDPGSIKVSTKTDENGAFNFTKLPAGKYKLTIAGQSPQSITVGANKTISGMLTRNDDGTASITVGGRKPVVFSGQIPGVAGVRVASGDVNGDGVESRKAAPKKAAVVKPSIAESNDASGRVLSLDAGDGDNTLAAPAPKGGDGKLAGLAGPGDPIPGVGVGLEGDDDMRTAPSGGGDKKLPSMPNTPISDTPIGLEGDPGSVKVSTTTDNNGAFNFTKLPAGKYKLTLPGLPSQSFTVGANGIVGGKVMRGSDGSITVIRKAGDKPLEYVVRTAPKDGDGKSAAAEPCCIFIKPPVTPRNGGDAKLPGIINNSETETATVEAINVSRDVTPSKGGDAKLPGILRVINNSETETATVEAINVSRDVTPSKGSDAEKPGLATPGTPIQGIPVGLEGDPGSIKVSTTTDKHGAYHFDNLPAGNYKMTIAGLPKQSIRAGASGPINGEVMRANNGAIYLTALKSTKGGHIDVLEWSWGLANKGTVQLPGPARGRVINNSETDTSNVDASNRDHIDRDAQFDVKKRTDVQPDGPGNVRLRVPADVSTLRGTAPGPDERGVTLGTAAMANESHTDGLMILRKNSGGITISAPTGADTEGIRPILDVDGNSSTDPIATSPKGGDVKDEKLPGIAGTPIQGTEVGLEGDPGSVKVSAKTDKNGTFNFTKLPAGKYKLTLPGLPSRSFTVRNDGIAGGKVMRGSDGLIRIWDDTDIVHSTAISQTTGHTGLERTATAPKGGDDKLPGLAGEPIVITDQLGNSHVLVSRAATPTKGGDDKLPGLEGKPVAGIGVSLGKPGGGIMATVNSSGGTIAAETMLSSRTDSQGNFHFDKLPGGNYELTLPGLPAQLLTVGADGIAGGKVMRGSDGSMSIFDRRGNRTADSSKGGGSKTAEKPVGFGSGNNAMGGPGGMGLGGGMAPPGAGPAVGGAGPAMGGPGSAMGGPGSTMRNR